MSVSETEKECPLCMESLDWDDLGFFPCSCGYQICRFCWHRLRTDENGLCPACRQAFPDIPVSFNQEVSAEELKKQKKRNKEKNRSNKDQVIKPQDLATLRVVQKNLVFVIGLSSRLTQEDLRREFAYFGKIIKFVHNKSTAYITYSKPEEAVKAIRTLNASAAHETAVQNLHFQSLTNGTSANGVLGVHGASSNISSISVPLPANRLKASLGTTKYCNHFLRSQQCPKVGECMYLHEIAEAEASFTKEQMQAGKHVEYEKKLMDSYLSKLELQSNLLQSNGIKSANSIQAQQQQQQHPHQHSLQMPNIIHQNPDSGQCSPLNQSPTIATNKSLRINHTNQIYNGDQSNIPDRQIHACLTTSPTQQQANHNSKIDQLIKQHSTTLDTPQCNDTDILSSKSFQSRPQTRGQQHSKTVMGHDLDSEDDGLDFDPISVSTSGLRDLLLDQQVQQAKQNLQNSFQRLNQTQSITNVLFQQKQQNQRLNLQPNGGPVGCSGFDPMLTNLGMLSNSNGQQGPQQQQTQIQQQQLEQQNVTWQNLRSLFPNVNITFNRPVISQAGTNISSNFPSQSYLIAAASGHVAASNDDSWHPGSNIAALNELTSLNNCMTDQNHNFTTLSTTPSSSASMVTSATLNRPGDVRGDFGVSIDLVDGLARHHRGHMQQQQQQIQLQQQQSYLQRHLSNQNNNIDSCLVASSVWRTRNN